MSGHRQLVERVMGAFVSGKVDELDATLDEGYIQHNALEPGRDGVKQLSEQMHLAFPDLHVEIHDVISEGDKVVARMTAEGTHTGAFLGIEPTGRKIRMDSIDIWRVSEGKLVEHWDITDRLGLMQQLGLMSVRP